MTRFVLVRHGQTEWNRVERFRGRADIPLNETGLAQAKALARRLASWAIAAVYTSPLQRTRETGKAIARQLGLEAEPLEGLIDIDYGALQGLAPEEAEQRYPNIYRQWLREPHIVHFPQGGSLAQLRERVLESLRELVESHQGEMVVLVGHKIMNKVLLCAVLGLDNSHIWQIEQDEAALNIFVRQGSLWEMARGDSLSHPPVRQGSLWETTPVICPLGRRASPPRVSDVRGEMRAEAG